MQLQECVQTPAQTVHHSSEQTIYVNDIYCSSISQFNSFIKPKIREKRELIIAIRQLFWYNSFIKKKMRGDKS